MSKMFIKDSTLVDIGNAIREKEGSTEKISPLEMGDRIRAIESGGVGYDLTAMLTAIKINSLNGFGQNVVRLNLPLVTSLAQFCVVSDIEEKNITVEELEISCGKVTVMSQFMSNSTAATDSTLRILTLNMDTSEVTNWSSATKGLAALEEIRGTPLDLSSASSTVSSVFNIKTLREIRLQGFVNVNLSMTSAHLSADSLRSVISCLSPTASGMALTLSQAAVNVAFETSEGVNDGSTSTEWLTLTGEHSNWTVSLV